MNKPSPATEKEFNRNGLFFFPNESFYDRKDFQKIGLQVEIGALADAKLIEIDFMVTAKSKRGVVTCFTDFKLIDRGEQKVLQFIAWQKIPDGTFPGLRDVSGEDAPLRMSFANLCWYVGNESVDPNEEEIVFTKTREGESVRGDLGWHLPCRFIDPVINALGLINDFMLSGILEDAMLYGPLTLDREQA